MIVALSGVGGASIGTLQMEEISVGAGDDKETEMQHIRHNCIAWMVCLCRRGLAALTLSS